MPANCFQRVAAGLTLSRVAVPGTVLRHCSPTSVFEMVKTLGYSLFSTRPWHSTLTSIFVLSGAASSEQCGRISIEYINPIFVKYCANTPLIWVILPYKRRIKMLTRFCYIQTTFAGDSPKYLLTILVLVPIRCLTPAAGCWQSGRNQRAERRSVFARWPRSQWAYASEPRAESTNQA